MMFLYGQILTGVDRSERKEFARTADCKSAGYAFGGSNPPPSTILLRWNYEHLAHGIVRGEKKYVLRRTTVERQGSLRCFIGWKKARE